MPKALVRYSDGFVPVFSPAFEDQLPGCTISDDFNQALGNQDEALLAAAINYAETGLCPIQNKPAAKAANIQGTGIAIKTPNTILESVKIYTHINEPSTL